MATYAAYRHIELDKVGCGKRRVLKPPGGGSSDIFGAESESSRGKVKTNANQSQLSKGFFAGTDDMPDHASDVRAAPVTNGIYSASSGGGSAPETPRSKPGNDSYKNLFGPPDALPPSTPNSKTYRSSISLSASSSESISAPHKNGTGSMTNDFFQNDLIAFRRIKRFRGASGMARNPVTGDGVDMKPPSSRRFLRKTKEGNPVTGAGYDNLQQNGGGGGSRGSSIAGSDKSSTDSSPSPTVPRMKNRVPPGGFSSGLW